MNIEIMLFVSVILNFLTFIYVDLLVKAEIWKIIIIEYRKKFENRGLLFASRFSFPF